jgi:hypothetical protein
VFGGTLSLLPDRKSSLATQGLLKDFERMVKFSFMLTSVGNTTHCMKDRSVISSAEEFANFWQ